MTTTEAIKQLQIEHDLIAHERDLDGSQFAPALLEALAMAIEALKARDMTLYMNLPEVSVEEAVEILKRNNRIELLPSAQPEKTQLSGESTTKDSTFDCISRQAAIDALMAILDKPSHAEFLYTDEICGALNGLPSAQPKPDKNPLPEQPNSDRLGVKTGETCTDTINRQDAIDARRNTWN